MRFISAIVRLVAICGFQTLAHPDVESQKTLGLDYNVTVRLAEADDAEAVAGTLLEAFADSPHIKYIYQYGEKYRDLIRHCMVQSVHEILEMDDAFVHIGILDSLHGSKVVSAAVWDTPWTATDGDGLASRTKFSAFFPWSFDFKAVADDGPECLGPAVNMTRAIDFSNKLGNAEQRLLIDVYSDHQLYLGAIGTIPQYQGHDIAGMLLREGLKYGNGTFNMSNNTLYATLSATEAGEPLYFQNDYVSIENVSIPSIDGDQFFRFDVMERPLRTDH